MPVTSSSGRVFTGTYAGSAADLRMTSALTSRATTARFGTAFMPDYWADILEGQNVISFMSDKLFYVYQKYNP